MWKTGHSLIKAKMKETGAPLAGEMSGHIFFGERWYGFDDAHLHRGAPARDPVAQRRSERGARTRCPTSFSTPELNVPCAEGEPPQVVERLQAEAEVPGRRRSSRSTACASNTPTASA